MRTWKRVLAFVLAMVMALSLTSMPTFAEDKSTYDIVINYTFEDGNIVSEPYTAELAAGTSFSTTVTFPTVQGYLPYVGEEQQDSIALNYESMNEDVTINVVYKPTNVNYTVIHYRQNLDNDNYELLLTESKTGLTGSQVPEVAFSEGNSNYDAGFYSLVYERPNIAADGSTVIEIYYDRYYRLLNFELDGGYGTDPIFARYGTSIGDVPNPTKAGYTFGGWSETVDGTTPATLPTTMPAADKTYYAIWTPVDAAKVTVVFWGENPNDEGYSYLSDFTREIYREPETEFTFNPEEDDVICTADHTHGDGCIGCGKTAHTHSALGGSCYTLTCTVEGHTHGTGCYAGVGSQQNVYTGLPDNPQEGQVYDHWIYGNLIYIKGSWYRYSGSTASGSIAPTTCGKTEINHTHNADCYNFSCTTPEHTHTDVCYTCGKAEHTHTDACYANKNLPGSTLWTFVKSDTVTVAADGSTVVNVYYDRTTFTLHFREAGSSSDDYGTITEKWGSNIRSKFEAKNTQAGTALWSTSSNGSGPWTGFLDKMPQENRTYYANSSSGSTHTAVYYGEPLSGTSLDTLYTSKIVFSGTLKVTKEDKVEIEGFTYHDSWKFNNTTYNSTANEADFNNAKFYYSRNTFKVEYNNYVGAPKTEAAKYGASLNTDTFNWKPTDAQAPDIYEPGSVTFGGWYLNPQCSGEAYDFTDKTMPAGPTNKDGEVALVLYAKWVPVTRTVKFYLTESSTEVYAPVDIDFAKAEFTVPHGDNIAKEYVEHHLTRQAMNEAKPNGDYTFVMWYYYDDNGAKHPFDPTTQIRKDLTLYGEWSSNTLKEYTVQFVLKDNHSVKVADDITGSGLAGTTKTFDAKGGTELYAAYQEGYFPTVQSQSLLLDIDSNSLVITFEYVPVEAVPYTVKYVEKDTGNSLAPDKVVSDNRKAVVTETFVAISGYMPDAYQKRLVVTPEGENVLYFYYTKDTEHALYKITHFTQNLDGTTWTEYASSTATGDIGTRYTASPMTISGFTYDHMEYVVNGTKVTDVTAQGAALTAEGLEINLYYVRNEYPYQVRYLEETTGKQLAAPKDGTGKYGQVISESAIDITVNGKTDAYDKLDPTSQTLNIRIEESETAQLNIITFYYRPVYYVHHVQSGTLNESLNEKLEVLKVPQSGVDLTNKVADGFLYGGTFDAAACTNTNIDYKELFNNTDGNPKQTQPQAGDHFYIWEVADTYLSARNFYVSHHVEGTGVLTVCRYYLLTNVDRLLYQDVGFTIDGDDDYSSGDNGHSEFQDVEAALTGNTPVYGKVKVIKGGNYEDTLYLDSTGAIKLSKVAEDYEPNTDYGYMGAYRLDQTQFESFKEDGTTFTPYWVTLDGVKVTGMTTRTGSFDEVNPSVPKAEDESTGSTCTFVKNVAPEETALMSLRYVPEYLLDDSTPDSVTITISDNGTLSQLETLPGDVRGQLSYTAPAGKLFAGWYSDEACTTAAQLTDVQEDITVYAKYVSDDYLTLKYNRNGIFRVTGVSLVSAIDSDSYAETGFIINGETYVVDSYATRYRLLYTAGSLFGGDVARRAPLMTLDYALSGSGTLEVIPYWVTLDGTTVTGATRTLTYTSRTIRG